MTETVHVITELGPTDGPGLIVPAQLLGVRARGYRIFYGDIDLGAVGPAWHTNQPCNPMPHP
jgi:hypothetical protein